MILWPLLATPRSAASSWWALSSTAEASTSSSCVRLKQPVTEVTKVTEVTAVGTVSTDLVQVCPTCHTGSSTSYQWRKIIFGYWTAWLLHDDLRIQFNHHMEDGRRWTSPQSISYWPVCSQHSMTTAAGNTTQDSCSRTAACQQHNNNIRSLHIKTMFIPICPSQTLTLQLQPLLLLSSSSSSSIKK